MHGQAEFILLYGGCQNGNLVSESWSRGLFLTASNPRCSIVFQGGWDGSELHSST